MSELHSASFVYWRPAFLGWIAEVLWQAGRPKEGLKAVEEGFDYVESRGELWFSPELHRLRGELLLASDEGMSGAARDEFVRARDIARQYDSKLLELRAAVSLAKLLHRQGESNAGSELLTPVYDWFTEGFDLPDLMEAKALVDELA